MDNSSYWESPIGWVHIKDNGTAVEEIAFAESRINNNPPTRLALETIDELSAYFEGSLKEFSLILESDGTEFQKTVWQELMKIPFGETTSYGELASLLGDPNLSRAVGMANGKNPIAIVIPCHRVIGSDGSLTGYAGGLDRKKALLQLEGMEFQRELF
jgi:O-6-methylguanine DNA methyltransferase